VAALMVSLPSAASAGTLVESIFYVDAAGTQTTGCVSAAAACQTLAEGIAAAEASADPDVLIQVAPLGVRLRGAAHDRRHRECHIEHQR
jgi:hypothetical protein